MGSKPYCAQDYERVHQNQYIAYNDNFGSYTCLKTKDQLHSANFTVSKWRQGIDDIGAFPEIFAGFEYGRHPTHSWNPVVEDQDGSPEASVTLHAVPGGSYNGAGTANKNSSDI